MLKNIIGFLKKYKTNNFKKNCQNQAKQTVIKSRDMLHNEIETAKAVSGSFDVIVVGVSFYQKALEKICSCKSEEGVKMLFPAKIIPYDNNPVDPYAVRIEIKGETVGHLSRNDACKWRSKMLSEGFSGVTTCPAKILWDKGFEKTGSYSVCLDVDLTLSDSKPEINSAQAIT